MNKDYTPAEMDIISFSTEDIILSSTDDYGDLDEP